MAHTCTATDGNLNDRKSLQCVGYLLWEVGCVLSYDSPQEPSCSSDQTPPLEGDKLGSYRYTHSAFEHLKYSSTPWNTWKENIDLDKHN